MNLLPAVAVALGLGMVLGACDGENGLPPDVECGLECPPGTKLLNFNSTNYGEELNNGAFFVSSNECETACVPITPCKRPNVPVVTLDTYVCQGLPGLSDLGDPSDTDFSWMADWDSQAVQP